MRKVVAARQISNAALRVPDRGPFSVPKLFIDEGARQALERKLRLAFGGKPVILSITDNQRGMLSYQCQSDVHYVWVHHMFLSAGPEVTDAVASYFTHGDKDSSLTVDRYISDNQSQLVKRKKVSLKSQGETHDLTEIYNRLNEKYFDGQIRALITWGQNRKTKKPRNSIRFGSYTQTDRLIQIHPVLDNPWVPRYFVEFIVYHEMLHQEFPVDDADERRCLHPPEFLEREQEFRTYARAIEWEKKNLPRVLRF